MKVFVLIDHVFGADINVAVCSTREKANALIKEMGGSSPFGGELEIEEFEVDEDAAA